MIQSSNLYEAYGNIVLSTGSSQNNRLANTKERDFSIGLDNHGFRYYDPEVGRYVCPDPIGYGDGPNWWLYVQNNPINFIDPLGLNGDEAEDGQKYDDDVEWMKKPSGHFPNDLLSGRNLNTTAARIMGAPKFMVRDGKRIPMLGFDPIWKPDRSKEFTGALDLHHAAVEYALAHREYAGLSPESSASDKKTALKKLYAAYNLLRSKGLDDPQTEGPMHMKEILDAGLGDALREFAIQDLRQRANELWDQENVRECGAGAAKLIRPLIAAGGKALGGGKSGLQYLMKYWHPGTFGTGSRGVAKSFIYHYGEHVIKQGLRLSPVEYTRMALNHLKRNRGIAKKLVNEAGGEYLLVKTRAGHGLYTTTGKIFSFTPKKF